MKHSFKNDYSTGCHPAILQALLANNDSQEEGYGEDSHSKAAARMISDKVGGNPSVYFVTGGTQANLVVIASLLRPYESVIAAQSGHINVHEAGAIEATGHRIQAVKTNDGKLTPAGVQQALDLFEFAHTTVPKLVYISNATEMGTLYSKAELIALSEFCRSKDLVLFMDGARLAYALSALTNDITLSDLGRYTDVFYIGGTKAGALIGEAIVINTPALKENFIFNLKQRGALLAKGRLLGIQFTELFRNDLFLQLGAHANTMAGLLAASIAELGYSFLTDTKTNQIFPVFPNNVINQLQENYGFYHWSKLDEIQTAVRLVTCWSTEEKTIREFVRDLEKITGTKVPDAGNSEPL